MESDSLEVQDVNLYQSLGLREIRLLLIRAAPFDDPLVCDLIIRTVDENQLYDALSCAWGGTEHRQMVILNKVSHEITANLGNALRHLRRTEEYLTLWVDSLCINQMDIDEKAIQIGMMGDIYRRAACVRVWIGLREDEDLRIEELSNLWKLPGNPFGLPYWRRVWIQQELTNAAEVIVHCGDRLSPFRWWTKACDPRFYFTLTEKSFISSKHYELVSGANLMASFRAMRKYTGRISDHEFQLQFLNSQMYRETSDPRDKIYGILDLVDHWHGGKFAADYNASGFRSLRERSSVNGGSLETP
ncbi:heterokaryon incompatibility protein-domain-containing protein [Rhexocercosporidium sp. MPI-PUGE-AT-0058]|nr:heterokaryon incompatibility protein-domain-containing protein [Rhexocercosporidium sp. MPI-PUGE-AT-0058]